MLESKLEYTVNELLKNRDPLKNKIYLDEVGELLLKLPYFKMLMEEYPDQDLGPLMFINLLNHLIIEKYEPNSLIWEYNDKVKGVYIIITGEVKIFKPPNRSHLMRFKKIKKKEDLTIDINNNKKTFSGKYKKATKNVFNKNNNEQKIMKRRTNVYRTSYYKMNTFKKKQNSNLKKSKSSISLNTDIKLEWNINNINHNKINKNYEVKEYIDEISLTEKDYTYKEILKYREVDYIETFGKMIGEDCLIQNLSFRPYCAETLTKCILGFLTSNDYHILFDKINSINKANIISFLYKVNYFNNKNNFVHKLYRGIKTILYSKGKYIYKQNEPFRNMYIIRKGNVNINIVKMIKIKTDIDSDLILGKKYKNINNIKDLSETDRFTCDRIFEIKGEYYEKKVYTIVNYGEGEILGNIEYYGNFRKYLSSALCLNNVELYEIDMKVYRRIESNENIEFLNNKTKKQIEFFKKRIEDANLVHKKNNKDYYIEKNKFIKAYYYNNPAIPLKEKEIQYINSPKNPLPTKIKLKNKILKSTKISPFCSYDWASFNNDEKNNLNKNFDNIINNEKKVSFSPFITNNKEYTNNFKDKNELNNDINNIRYNIINKNNEQKISLFNFNSINSNKNIKFKKLKKRDKKKYKTLSFLNKEKEKIARKRDTVFDYSKIFAFNEYSHFLSYSPLSQKNLDIINFNKINNKSLNNKKLTINFKTPPKRIYSSYSSKNMSIISTPKLNIYKNLYSKLYSNEKIGEENKNNENKERLEKRILSNKIIKKNINMTSIAFRGYRVFLPKKEDKNKIRDNRRLKSYKLSNWMHFGNKNNLDKKEDEKGYNNINNNFDRKNDIKRKTEINKDIYKSIKLKSFLEN